MLLPLAYTGVPREKQKDRAGFGTRGQLADSEGLYWKPTAETVAKTCPSALMAELNISITSRKENAALYDFALKMSPWVRSLSDLKPFQDLEEFQIKLKEKQSSGS